MVNTLTHTNLLELGSDIGLANHGGPEASSGRPGLEPLPPGVPSTEIQMSHLARCCSPGQKLHRILPNQRRGKYVASTMRPPVEERSFATPSSPTIGLNHFETRNPTKVVPSGQLWGQRDKTR
jgi:hypothetical protein